MTAHPLACRIQIKNIARRAMVERGLLPDFSPQVQAELNAITQAATETGPQIRDLRNLLWCSIDNDDSRDLDQLTVAEELTGGAVKILVAIADVDATVKSGTALDIHAQTNTTSVYTGAQIFPMFPEKLSTDLTSLGENQERLSVVIEFTVGPASDVTGSDVYRARVLNHAKLAYNSVAAWLDGKGPIPPRIPAVPGLEAQLRLQDRVAQSMKVLRHSHGSLSLETIQAHAIFNGDVLADLRPDEKNRAKDLIENFMIAANRGTVAFLDHSGFPKIQRILRTPERWERIVALAAQLGERLPDAPDARALEEFLTKRQQADPLRFPDLSLCVVKLLGRGEYVAEIPGKSRSTHFALAVNAYTHSTAPNRRYPDVITQRLVKAALAGDRPPYDTDELTSLAQRCTDQEANASKVERQTQKSAAACLLQNQIGNIFEAIVTGASEKGTWARLFTPPVEGRVIQGSGGLDVGDRLKVKLLGTDVERGFIDFARVRGSK